MMDEPRPHRVQLSRTKGWRMPENTMCVSRPSRFGNPFAVHTVVAPGEKPSVRYRVGGDGVTTYKTYDDSAAGITSRPSFAARTSPAGAHSTSRATPTFCWRSPMPTDTLLEREVATKPPPRWRNYYVVIASCQTWDGRVCQPGDDYIARQTHPSKEIAEQRAMERLAERLEWPSYETVAHCLRWRGAYPEGERP